MRKEVCNIATCSSGSNAARTSGGKVRAAITLAALSMLLLPCMAVVNQSENLAINVFGLAYDVILLCVGKYTVLGQKAVTAAANAYEELFNDKLED